MFRFFSFLKSVFVISDKKKHKIAKIISFLVGAYFNFIGIICVIVWKYLFCDKEENSKYCVRLSILGFIVKCIICAKFAFYTLFSPLQLETKEVNNFIKNNIHKQNNVLNTNTDTIFVDDDFFNFNLSKINNDIKNIHEEFFKKQRKIIEEAKNQQIRSHLYQYQQNLKDEILDKELENNLHKFIQQDVYDDYNGNNKKEDLKNIHIKKNVKIENGYQTTTIEKIGPNFHQKNVYIEYVGDNNTENKKSSKKREPFKKKINADVIDAEDVYTKKQIKQKRKKLTEKNKSIKNKENQSHIIIID